MAMVEPEISYKTIRRHAPTDNIFHRRENSYLTGLTKSCLLIFHNIAPDYTHIHEQCGGIF
jgi:hypothetical protein